MYSTVLWRKATFYTINNLGSEKTIQLSMPYRKQFVYVNGENSDLRELSCGVPQGSVLGPLLFLIYINNQLNISDKLEFYLFADDTNIYYENESLEKLEKTINKEVKNPYLWLSVNQLALNIEKHIFCFFILSINH